jgi:hypothetical protein
MQAYDHATAATGAERTAWTVFVYMIQRLDSGYISIIPFGMPVCARPPGQYRHVKTQDNAKPTHVSKLDKFIVKSRSVIKLFEMAEQCRKIFRIRCLKAMVLTVYIKSQLMRMQREPPHNRLLFLSLPQRKPALLNL